MTVCNMSIEAGARAGMIAPDAHTFAYLEGPRVRTARARFRRGRRPLGTAAHRSRGDLRSFADVPGRGHRAADHLGHQSGPSRLGQRARFPTRRVSRDEVDQKSAARALEYMGLQAGHAADRFPDRPRLHRLLHERADRRLAGGGGSRSRRTRGLAACRRWWCPAAARSSDRPRRKVWTRSSATPVSIGAKPAAACAWE